MNAKKLQLTVLAAALSLAGATAQATVTVLSNTSSLAIYESAASFQTDASRVAVDTLDDLSYGDQGNVLVRDLGTTSYTVASSEPLFAVGDDADRYLSTTFPSGSLLFAGFSDDARGFGGYFFGGDADGVPVRASVIELTIIDSTGTLVVRIDDTSATGFVGFLGLGTVQAATISGASDRYYPTVNDVTVALAPVPEPGTYAMLLTGLAVLPFAARRRRQ